MAVCLGHKRSSSCQQLPVDPWSLETGLKSGVERLGLLQNGDVLAFLQGRGIIGGAGGGFKGRGEMGMWQGRWCRAAGPHQGLAGGQRV